MLGKIIEGISTSLKLTNKLDEFLLYYWDTIAFFDLMIIQ